MLFSSTSEYKAQQMTVDFLNNLGEKTSGEEMADRLFNLSREMARKKIRSADFNLSLMLIRQKLGITDQVWSAMVEHMNRKMVQGPIIISSEN